MGIGNITELTAADTTGVNAVLIAICQELGVRAVLTTEVIPWARGAVREIDVARRLMHYAMTHHTLPKHIDDRLVTVKDPRSSPTPKPISVRCRHRSPTRTFASSPTATRSRCSTASASFVAPTSRRSSPSSASTNATHAFYLGKELAKAKLAITLGKTYRQEGALSWGYLTPPDEPHREHMRVTARRHRPRPEPQ